MRYTVEFPARVTVGLETYGGDEVAFAEAVERVRVALRDVKGYVRVEPFYRKGDITERTPDHDPRD